jgi:DNA topoisomerase II
VVGGRHGYGAKLTNIFSSLFELETYDSKRNILYSQCWKNNMATVHDPVLLKQPITSELTDFTKITFEPDLSRFVATVEQTGTNGSVGKPAVTSVQSEKERDHLIDCAMKLFERRVYDMAATLPLVQLSFNDQVIPINNFADYARMYATKPIVDSTQEIKSDTAQLGDVDALASGSLPAPGITADKIPIMYIRVNPRWEVAVMRSAGSFDSVSFVNNVWTSKGGTHVDLVTNQVDNAATSFSCTPYTLCYRRPFLSCLFSCFLVYLSSHLSVCLSACLFVNFFYLTCLSVCNLSVFYRCVNLFFSLSACCPSGCQLTCD